MTEQKQDRGWARWRTVELVITAVVAAALGLIFMAYSLLYVVLVPVFGQVGIMLLLGFYYITGVLVPYIVRRPAAALLASFLAAVTEMLAGSPFGIAAIWAGLIQGAGAEAVFALTRWRNYRWYVLVLAAVVSGMFAFIYEYFLFSYGALAVAVQLGLFLVRIPSAALLAGLLGKWIGDALTRAGVLKALRISRETRDR
jgi:energy-coupling factor transport system substrate-specific component